MSDPNSIPQWVPAVTGFGGVVVGSLITWAVQARLLGRRIKADEALAERRFEYDKKLAERKFEFDKLLSTHKLEADTALAERKFEFDRNLIDWKRRTELAEQTLADFYKVKELFRASRQPFSFAGEGRSRPGAENDQDQGKDAIYAPLERLNKEFTFLSELHARRFRFMALFGAKTDELFNAITLSYNEVQHATLSLLKMKGLPDNLREKYEGIIGWVLDENDPFQERISAVVSEIEALCRPVLEVRPK